MIDTKNFIKINFFLKNNNLPKIIFILNIYSQEAFLTYLGFLANFKVYGL
jgi:hypothetical protein